MRAETMDNVGAGISTAIIIVAIMLLGFVCGRTGTIPRHAKCSKCGVELDLLTCKSVHNESDEKAPCGGIIEIKR